MQAAVVLKVAVPIGGVKVRRAVSYTTLYQQSEFARRETKLNSTIPSGAPKIGRGQRAEGDRARVSPLFVDVVFTCVAIRLFFSLVSVRIWQGE